MNETAHDDAARRAPACTLVIFGASGDLTERKLLPAIRQLAAHHRLLPEFALVGVARTAMGDEEWADKCLAGEGTQAGGWAPKASFRYVSGGYDDRTPRDPRKPPSSSSATAASGATYSRAQRPCRPGLGGQRGVHLAPAAVDLPAGPVPDGP